MNNLSIYQIMHNELKGINSFEKFEKRKSKYRTKLLLIEYGYSDEWPRDRIEYIQTVISNYFNLSIEMIHEKTRKREIVQARQIAMYFSKNLTKLSLEIIGLKIGRKDHATVLHACKTINNLLETDKRFRFQVEEIEEIIMKRINNFVN